MEYGSDGFNIDRDYKNFINENNFGNVELINVNFSNYKDSALKAKEKENEGILNLISNNEIENESIEENGYKKMTFPNYTIDAKTLNGILFKNFLFEDFGIMFQYYIHKVEELPKVKNPSTSQENFDRLKSMSNYFKQYKDIFESFTKNSKQLTIIINNIKELKETFCTLMVLKIIVKFGLNKQYYDIGEKSNKKTVSVSMPDKVEIENAIEPYFLKEGDQNKKKLYSSMNYYYASDEEKEMIKKASLEFDGLKFSFIFDKEIYKEIEVKMNENNN